MTKLKSTSKPSGNWLLTIALSAITFVLLWVFRTQQFTGDSLWYAKDALNGTQMFHPHHLMFTPAIRLLFLALSSLGIDFTVLEVGQLFNISFASATVGLIHRVLNRLVAPKTAILVSLILLFCNGFWSYSTQIEVYIPGIFFSLVLLWSLLDKKPSTAKFGIAIMAFAMAVLFHQTNVLLVIPLSMLMGKPNMKRAMIISVISGCLVLGAYIWVMNLEGYPLTLGGFTAFSLKYAVSGQDGWGTFTNWMPIGWFELFASQTGNIIRQSYAHVVVYWMVFTFGILWLIYFAFKNLKKVSSRQPAIVFSLIWIISNYLFFLWWLPKEGEFFIASLVPLAVILGLQVDQINWRFGNFVLPSILTVIISFNGLAFYQKHTQPNEFGQRAMELAAISDQNTVVITDFFTEQYLEFFHHIKSENTDIVYGSIYDNRDPKLLESISQNKRLIISQGHISPVFMVNGFSGKTHEKRWAKGIHHLLEGVCSIDEQTILNEDFWIIERCQESLMTIDSAMIVLEISER